MKDIDQIRRDNMGIIEKEAGGPTAAGNLVGMSQTQWTNLRSGAADSKTGKPRGMRKDTARRIEDGAGKESGWLDIPHPKGDEGNVTRVELAQKLPLISWVIAGEWCESPDLFQPGDADDWIPCPVKHGPNAYALRVKGDSMTSPYPGQRSYPEGIIIFVDPGRNVENGSRIVAKDPETGEVTFKLYVEDGGRRYLKPINTSYDSILITGELHICGVVIGSFMPE